MTPFIDDSELAVDELQYFPQTKQQGFYVSSGEVALLNNGSINLRQKAGNGAPRTVQNIGLFPMLPVASMPAILFL
jgi:hypothetical protein